MALKLSAFLYYTLGISFLANKFQALTHNSEHDKIIYKKMVENFNMTEFEYKILENEAFKENFQPNENFILKALEDPEYSASAELFILSSGTNIKIAKWNMNEIIELNLYKQSLEKMNKIYNMINFYHKQHFLMSIGVIKWKIT